MDMVQFWDEERQLIILRVFLVEEIFYAHEFQKLRKLIIEQINPFAI